VQAFTYENARRLVKRQTLNHWQGRLGKYPLGYQIMPVKWQSDRFIRTASCDAVWSNKSWNRKIYWWFCSHFQV